MDSLLSSINPVGCGLVTSFFGEEDFEEDDFAGDSSTGEGSGLGEPKNK